MSYYNTCPDCGAHMDSVSICETINHLLAALNGRGDAIFDRENPEWKLAGIKYSEEEDRLYFECRVADDKEGI